MDADFEIFPVYIHDRTKSQYSSMRLFSHIFPIFLLALRLLGIIASSPHDVEEAVRMQDGGTGGWRRWENCSDLTIQIKNVSASVNYRMLYD
jgi:hypothetical protein